MSTRKSLRWHRKLSLFRQTNWADPHQSPPDNVRLCPEDKEHQYRVFGQISYRTTPHKDRPACHATRQERCRLPWEISTLYKPPPSANSWPAWRVKVLAATPRDRSHRETLPLYTNHPGRDDFPKGQTVHQRPACSALRGSRIARGLQCLFAIITGIKPYDKLHSILLGSLEHPVHDIILFRDPRKFCWNIKEVFLLHGH